jgi:asparagine synthetase B (glutamine-hydrolysing)
LLKRIKPLRTKFENYEPLWNASGGLGQFLANDGFSLKPTDIGPEALVPGLASHRASAIAKMEARLRECDHNDPMQKLLWYVRTSFMEEGLLMKMDRMTMAHGLEARVPFLDHQLVEFNAGISPAMRLHQRRTKAVLRAIAEKRLPAEIASRRQHGFLVPLDQWFEGSFASWVSSLLSPETLRRRQMFDVDAVTGILRQYRDTGKNARVIWSLVLLELWFRKFVD